VSGESTLGDHGVSEIKWFTIDEAIKLECLPGIKEFLEVYSRIN